MIKLSQKEALHKSIDLQMHLSFCVCVCGVFFVVFFSLGVVVFCLLF